MKALTIREPWATLVAIGAKTIETRSWAAPDWLIGQRIAIHAGKKITGPEVDFATGDGPIADALRAANVKIFWRDGQTVGHTYQAFSDTRGCVIATAVLSGCMRFNEINRAMIDRHELTFGDFTTGRYGWLLRDVQRLPEPVPARGALGIWTWNVPEGLVAA